MVEGWVKLATGLVRQGPVEMLTFDQMKRCPKRGKGPTFNLLEERAFLLEGTASGKALRSEQRVQ